MNRTASTREETLFAQCELRGFVFTNPGHGGPLVGIRRSEDYVDTIHIEGLGGNCLAWRQRVGRDGPRECEVQGSAETVMVAVINWGVARLCTGGGPSYALG